MLFNENVGTAISLVMSRLNALVCGEASTIGRNKDKISVEEEETLRVDFILGVDTTTHNKDLIIFQL